MQARTSGGYPAGAPGGHGTGAADQADEFAAGSGQAGASGRASGGHATMARTSGGHQTGGPGGGGAAQGGAAVHWLSELPAEVFVEAEAGPGQVLFSVPLIPLRPPSVPVEFDAWLAMRHWYRALRDLADQDLVLVTGLLSWRPPDGPPVRGHLLSTPVEIVVDDRTERVDVVLAGPTTPLDHELLGGVPGYEPGRAAWVWDAVQAGQGFALRASVSDVLRKWCAAAFAADDGPAAVYRDDWAPGGQPGEIPAVRLAPALAVRRRARSTGLAAYYDLLISRLGEPPPDGLVRFLAADLRVLHVPDPKPNAAAGLLAGMTAQGRRVLVVRPDTDTGGIPPRPDLPRTPPLTEGEVAELLRLLSRRTLAPPADTAALPDPNRILALVNVERAVPPEASGEVARRLRQFDPAVLTRLTGRVGQVDGILNELGLGAHPSRWPSADPAARAFADLLARRRPAVWDRVAEMSVQADRAHRAARSLRGRRVVLPPDASARDLADAAHELRAHLLTGGTLKRGPMRSAAQRKAEPLLATVTVDGQPPTSLPLLEIVLTHLTAEIACQDLHYAWDAAGVPFRTDLPLADRAARFADAHARLARVRILAPVVAEVSELGIPVTHPLQWHGLTVGLAAAHLAAEADRATAALTHLRDAIDPSLTDVRAALDARDPDAYTRALHALAEAHRIRTRRDALLARLHAVHPDLAARMTADPSAFSTLPRTWASAWTAARETDPDAVPLWDVPAAIPPVPDSLDAIILDNVHDAGPEALFLLWYTPRVILLGRPGPDLPPLDAPRPPLPQDLHDALAPTTPLYKALLSRALEASDPNTPRPTRTPQEATSSPRTPNPAQSQPATPKHHHTPAEPSAPARHQASAEPSTPIQRHAPAEPSAPTPTRHQASAEPSAPAPTRHHASTDPSAPEQEQPRQDPTHAQRAEPAPGHIPTQDQVDARPAQPTRQWPPAHPWPSPPVHRAHPAKTQQEGPAQTPEPAQSEHPQDARPAHVDGRPRMGEATREGDHSQVGAPMREGERLQVGEATREGEHSQAGAPTPEGERAHVGAPTWRGESARALERARESAQARLLRYASEREQAQAGQRAQETGSGDSRGRADAPDHPAGDPAPGRMQEPSRDEEPKDLEVTRTDVTARAEQSTPVEKPQGAAAHHGKNPYASQAPERGEDATSHDGPPRGEGSAAEEGVPAQLETGTRDGGTTHAQESASGDEAALTSAPEGPEDMGRGRVGEDEGRSAVPRADGPGEGAEHEHRRETQASDGETGENSASTVRLNRERTDVASPQHPASNEAPAKEEGSSRPDQRVGPDSAQTRDDAPTVSHDETERGESAAPHASSARAESDVRRREPSSRASAEVGASLPAEAEQPERPVGGQARGDAGHPAPSEPAASPTDGTEDAVPLDECQGPVVPAHSSRAQDAADEDDAASAGQAPGQAAHATASTASGRPQHGPVGREEARPHPDEEADARHGASARPVGDVEAVERAEGAQAHPAEDAARDGGGGGAHARRESAPKEPEAAGTGESGFAGRRSGAHSGAGRASGVEDVAGRPHGGAHARREAASGERDAAQGEAASGARPEQREDAPQERGEGRQAGGAPSGGGAGVPAVRIEPGRSIVSYARDDLRILVERLLRADPGLSEDDVVARATRLLACPPDETGLVEVRIRYALHERG
ncbi:hypothetical protein DZF91_20270 [Actinomadura logoneensis]|uniref:Uncharacterized protein n=1 Tax=Actinomadura logoneensis TaxID=2293572 RepID=A0A372JIM0_9ACTN|nr:hypothetical protein [Actinomadura logoneensis]RFU39853.1 hypothetical protein DZF91_20270 [Actinomadura logoneensis]